MNFKYNIVSTSVAILILCVSFATTQDGTSTTEKPKWTWPPWLTLPSSLPTIPPGWTDWTPGGPFPTLPPGVTLVPPEWIEDAKVKIDELGTIQGAVSFTSPVTAPSRRKFFWFAGIPYANPKSYTDQNRFKPSELWTGPLPKNQNGVFAAINPLIWCPQDDILPFTTDLGEVLTAYKNRSKTQKARTMQGIKPQVQGVEDCLVLNVNTPKLPTKDSNDELLPVILFIHGGSFDGLFGGIFGGHRLLNRDVVLVTVNYRLGALGSLNLGIDQAPGNAAMYDIITSLKWVKKFISHFGGDKNKITVAGHSAGSVMASHLLTSKLVIDELDNERLINGIIGLSGSSLSQWATCKDPLTHNLRVSKFAGCYDDDVRQSKDGGSLTNEELEEIRNCMSNKSLEELIDAMRQYTLAERLEGRLGYDSKVPSIQKPENLNVPLFLEENPLEIIKRGDQHNISIMMGTTLHEGTFVLEDTYEYFLVPNNYTDNIDFIRNEFMPILLGALGLEDPSGELIHSLVHTYIGDAFWTDDFKSKIPGLIDIHSVFGFKAGAFSLVEMHSKLNPHSYYFSFEYDGLWSVDGGDVIPGGVGHIDSIFYLFQAFPLIFPMDQSVAYRFTDYWANFAIYGNPNGNETVATAAPYNGLNHAYLVIDGYDSTGYYCRDSWINNSLHLMKPKPTSPTTTTTTATSTNPPSESTTLTASTTQSVGLSTNPSTETTTSNAAELSPLIITIKSIFFLIVMSLLKSQQT